MFTYFNLAHQIKLTIREQIATILLHINIDFNTPHRAIAGISRLTLAAVTQGLVPEVIAANGDHEIPAMTRCGN